MWQTIIFDYVFKNIKKDVFSKKDFDLEYFKKTFPNNNNIEAKIRQQIQILRDKNFVTFIWKWFYKKNLTKKVWKLNF